MKFRKEDRAWQDRHGKDEGSSMPTTRLRSRACEGTSKIRAEMHGKVRASGPVEPPNMLRIR